MQSPDGGARRKLRVSPTSLRYLWVDSWTNGQTEHNTAFRRDWRPFLSLYLRSCDPQPPPTGSGQAAADDSAKTNLKLNTFNKLCLSPSSHGLHQRIKVCSADLSSQI